MGRMSSESGMGRMGSMSSMENVHVESIWLRSFSPPWPYLVSHCGTNLTLNPILRLLWLIQVITYYISYIIYYTYTLSKSSNITFASSNLLQLCSRIRKRTTQVPRLTSEVRRGTNAPKRWGWNCSGLCRLQMLADGRVWYIIGILPV